MLRFVPMVSQELIDTFLFRYYIPMGQLLKNFPYNRNRTEHISILPQYLLFTTKRVINFSILNQLKIINNESKTSNGNGRWRN